MDTDSGDLSQEALDRFVDSFELLKIEAEKTANKKRVPVAVINRLATQFQEATNEMKSWNSSTDGPLRYQELKEGDKNMNRIKAHVLLANMMDRADGHNIHILKMLINCIDKLSKTEKHYIVKETELITNYLDPVLSPIFHDPDNNRLFRWLNQKTNLNGDNDNGRPDGGMNVINQLQNVYALGFVEVKAIDASKKYTLAHTDTLRLALFCKAALDKDDIKCAIAVQAVGTHVTFFLCTIEHEALYPFIKLGRLDIPTSFENLPYSLSQLDTCARIIHTYNTFCVKRRRDESVRSIIKPSLSSSQLIDILHIGSRDESPSLKLTPSI